MNATLHLFIPVIEREGRNRHQLGWRCGNCTATWDELPAVTERRGCDRKETA